jgi:hypothetical protein
MSLILGGGYVLLIPNFWPQIVAKNLLGNLSPSSELISYKMLYSRDATSDQVLSISTLNHSLLDSQYLISVLKNCLISKMRFAGLLRIYAFALGTNAIYVNEHTLTDVLSELPTNAARVCQLSQNRFHDG